MHVSLFPDQHCNNFSKISGSLARKCSPYSFNLLFLKCVMFRLYYILYIFSFYILFFMVLSHIYWVIGLFLKFIFEKTENSKISSFIKLYLLFPFYLSTFLYFYVNKYVLSFIACILLYYL